MAEWRQKSCWAGELQRGKSRSRFCLSRWQKNKISIFFHKGINFENNNNNIRYLQIERAWVNLPTRNTTVGKEKVWLYTIRHRWASWHIMKKVGKGGYFLKGATGTKGRLSVTNQVWFNDLGKVKLLWFSTFMINRANPVAGWWRLQLLTGWNLPSKRRLSCQPESHLKLCLCWHCSPANGRHPWGIFNDEDEGKS